MQALALTWQASVRLVVEALLVAMLLGRGKGGNPAACAASLMLYHLSEPTREEILSIVYQGQSTKS